MKKIRIFSVILIVLMILITSFEYLSGDKKNKNIFAIDYSRDDDYLVIFDANGGELSGMGNLSMYEEIREGVYGVNDTSSLSNSSFRIGNKSVLYWSKDHLCSTKDLELNDQVNASSHSVYYACYEETNFDNNGIRYIQDGAFVSGDNVSCGDTVKLTKCYENRSYNGRGGGTSEYCEFNQINGNSASGVVYRNKLNKEPVSNCNSTYTAYFHEATQDITGYGLECGNTSYYSDGVCMIAGEKGRSVSTPNTSKLMYDDRKFIGWAADDDGVNVNCSGNLVRSSNVIINNDVHYYACYESGELCNNSQRITNGKGTYNIKVCYNAKKDRDGDIELTPVSGDYDELLQCENGYTLDNISKNNVINNTCTSEGTCSKTYELNCVGGRPKISASSAMVRDDGYGTVKFSAISNVGIKGYYASSYYEKPTLKSGWIMDSRGNYSLESTPGTVFLWAIDNNNQISYATISSVIDKVNVDTTLKTLEVKTNDGEKLNTEAYAFSDNNDGITSSDYVRLSNKVKDDSKILASGFNPFDTAYKVTTSSDKIAVYATPTSNDANYVSGYEPRTVNLDYGVNTILIKIQNKKGKVRTYTIIVTREDDRDATNLLKSLTVSEGKLNFDPYKNDYVVSVGKNKKSVSINGELSSINASYVDSYGPRKIDLVNDSTTVAMKVKSETGSIRAYTITFIKSGEESIDKNEALLSSLSLSKAYIAFDKNIYDYNTAVDFEIDSINIYALAENGGDSVTIYRSINGVTEVINNKNIELNVGANNITIIVANKDGKTKSYSINILRKENGLDISSNTNLSMLDVDGYDIDFDPEKLDYEIKIKREKTLVIAATPESNRTDVYIRGNDNLTAFSIVKIKVISEDGQFKEYTIDIKKDTVNKTIEIVGLISGVIIIICGIIIIRVKKKHKSINDYYAE